MRNPMPMKERYLKRFPQPARIGDLVGMTRPGNAQILFSDFS
jgi:hypothetical protein